MNEVISLIVTAGCGPFPNRLVDMLAAQTIAVRLELVCICGDEEPPARELPFASVRMVKARRGERPETLKNRGVQAATGAWIAFAAPEDELPPELLERLCAAAERTGAQAAVCDTRWRDKRMVSRYPLTEDNLYLRVCPVTEAADLLEAGAVIGAEDGAFVFAKLFRRDLLARFPFGQGEAGEDACAVLPALAAAGHVAYAGECVYTRARPRMIAESLPRVKAAFARAEALLTALARLPEERDRSIAMAAHMLPALAQLLCLGEAAEHRDRLEALFGRLRAFLPALTDANPFLAALYGRGAGWEREAARRLRDWLSEPGRDVAALYAWADFHPLVSIVIPVYNGSDYMREAIDSALAQTYDLVEVVVINDGSADDGETERIARSYGSRVCYVSKPNGGVATALNMGVEQMRGEYFSWLSHDDAYLPRKVENEVRWLALMEDRTTLVLEGCRLMDACGRCLCTVSPRAQYHERQLRMALFPLLRGAVNGCALLVHKSHFTRAGGFDPALRTTQDYDLWFRMFRNQPLLCMDSANVLSRVHSRQGSAADSAHFEECSRLWIGTMDGVIESERTAMDGSSEGFYRNMYFFLADCWPWYRNAVLHAAELAGLRAEPAPTPEPEPTFTLWRSRSWLLFKPLRAIQYARRRNGDGMANRAALFARYMRNRDLDRQSDEAIRARKCWRLTAPLRRAGALVRGRRAR